MAEKLAPHVKQIVGVDISQRCVDAFAERFKKLSIPPEQARAVKIELKGEENELDGQTFDMVVVSLPNQTRPPSSTNYAVIERRRFPSHRGSPRNDQDPGQPLEA